MGVESRFKALEYKYRHASDSLTHAKTKRDKLRKLLSSQEEAQALLQATAKEVQSKVSLKVSKLVSSALHGVFPDPYSLELEFVPKRGRTEAQLTFMKGNKTYDPMDSSGGGPIDVAAFSLRVALWSLNKDRLSPVLFLDEPFRNVSRDLQPQAAELLKRVSKRLKLQMVVVTHNKEISERADRVFRVCRRKGRSEMSTTTRWSDLGDGKKLEYQKTLDGAVTGSDDHNWK